MKEPTLFKCEYCKRSVSRLRLVDGYWLCVKYGCAKPSEENREEALDPWDPWKKRKS